MNITIVGSGHGGSAMAAVLAHRGHDVTITKLGNSLHSEHFLELQKNQTIRLTGIEGEGEFRIHTSTDPSESIPNADVIFVYYVSNYHEMVAERLAPFLHEKQQVVISPGYGGSLLFLKHMDKINNKSIPLFAEFETLPYSSRVREPGRVNISSLNVRHPFATLPSTRAQEVTDHLGPVIGECVPRSNILEVALHNPNLLIHSIGLLMNVSRVEGPAKDYSMYRHGFTESMWNVVNTLDNEKMDVLEKIGAPRITYFEEFLLRTFGEADVKPLDGFKRYAEQTTAIITTLDHRYITEDVPMGLGLLHSLGEATGVPTPICTSLINIANALLPKYDFWKNARTVSSLWDGSMDELLAYLSR